MVFGALPFLTPDVVAKVYKRFFVLFDKLKSEPRRLQNPDLLGLEMTLVRSRLGMLGIKNMSQKIIKSSQFAYCHYDEDTGTMWCRHWSGKWAPPMYFGEKKEPSQIETALSVLEAKAPSNKE